MFLDYGANINTYLLKNNKNLININKLIAVLLIHCGIGGVSVFIARQVALGDGALQYVLNQFDGQVLQWVNQQPLNLSTLSLNERGMIYPEAVGNADVWKFLGFVDRQIEQHSSFVIEEGRIPFPGWGQVFALSQNQVTQGEQTALGGFGLG